MPLPRLSRLVAIRSEEKALRAASLGIAVTVTKLDDVWI
jgi:hypothetical protein